MTTHNSTITLEQVPGEKFLVDCLQKHLCFLINDRLIKKGKLILFRRANYFIQVSLSNEKNHRENFEIPIPFKTEYYKDDGLIYFDYRVRSLEVESLPAISQRVVSTYFDKILEIQIVS